MGRGDRKRVRWAHDREKRKKERESRQAKERGTTKERGAAKKRS